jgi:DNA polymerase III delta prime subunit
LLTTNKLRYILPTIKSRTIVVPITKPTGSEVKEYLDAIGANQTVNAEMLFDFYQNSPISIYESMQDNTEALILNTINTVGKMLAKKQAPIASKEIAENIKPNGEVVLNILAWMLNNLAKSIATNNTPSFMKENEILIKKWNFIIKNTSLDGCFEFERYITKVKTLLMQGFNPDLSIYINSLLYNWYLSANEKS